MERLLGSGLDRVSDDMNRSDANHDVDSRQLDPAEVTTNDQLICLTETLKSLYASEADGGAVSFQALPSSTFSLARYITDIGLDRGIDLLTEVRRFERGLIEHALELTNGNQKRAAKLLGMQSSTLHTKIKKYDLKANRRKIARR